MKISKAHLKRLKASRDLRGGNASTFNMLSRNWKYYLFIGGIFGLASYFFIADGRFDYSLFLGGAFLGMLLRDITWFRLTSRFWPVSEAVTDWEKVDVLIEENET